MYIKHIKAQVVGIKSYNKETESGKKYTIAYANIVYSNNDNENLKGFEVDTIKTSVEVEEKKSYDLGVVYNKVNDKYYKEIVSATLLK